ncbi:MAG TPA: hypothetical protein VN258_20580 [Mobilitalea sp.]|nr:hypothetical protein [Mobilitalea sp.]
MRIVIDDFLRGRYKPVSRIDGLQTISKWNSGSIKSWELLMPADTITFFLANALKQFPSFKNSTPIATLSSFMIRDELVGSY